ncbi:hypothetical protein [Ferrovibrio xuzhouensis]|uniref:Polyphosphate kinase-2-related domain-containing protein n=1 Tax=Ferrovibrio xuzhouensis TaxID=1576914 RepID=A0ABV7VHT1_9PROT
MQSRVRREQYTRAKEDIFVRTSISEAPRHTVEGNDKKHARLNLIADLLSGIPYEEVLHEGLTLPGRVFDPHYKVAPCRRSFMCRRSIDFERSPRCGHSVKCIKG